MFEIDDFVYRNFEDPATYGNPMSDYRVLCPFCIDRVGTDDTKGKLHIGVDVQAVHCFRCGYSAGWIQFVKDILHCNYVEAIKELYVTPKIRDDISKTVMEGLTVPAVVKKVVEDLSLPTDFVSLMGTTEDCKLLQATAKKYARKRGFPEWFWARYNLGIAESVGWRLIIPVEKNYYQARALASWLEPKYTNPPTQAEEYLFNAGALEIYDEVVITEGCFNAMAVGENAIALLGKEAPKKKLARLLQSEVTKYIIALDKDAMVWSVRLAEELRRFGKEVTVWSFETEADSAEHGKYQTIHYDAFKTRMQLLMK